MNGIIHIMVYGPIIWLVSFRELEHTFQPMAYFARGTSNNPPNSPQEKPPLSRISQFTPVYIWTGTKVNAIKLWRNNNHAARLVEILIVGGSLPHASITVVKLAV